MKKRREREYRRIWKEDEERERKLYAHALSPYLQSFGAPNGQFIQAP